MHLFSWRHQLCSLSFSLALFSLCAFSELPSASAQDVDVGPFLPVLPQHLHRDETTRVPQLIALGHKLYFETQLSKEGDLSCNSCHGLTSYGVDNKPTSPGHKGQLGERNSPTVYNAAAHIAQFWDGRAKDVEEQALGPILNPVEMAMPSEEEVLKRLKADEEYVAMFAAAFPGDKEPLTYANVGKAIGAFERELVTPSRFDEFASGKADALTPAEKNGLKKFVEAGCVACHSGTYFGGSMYQKVGLVHPWPNQKDGGRSKITKNESEKMFFKVPSLRNVTETGPYFHDGSVSSLAEAVRLMAYHQLGRELPDEDVQAIVTFLGSLKGELPKEYLKAP